jgi:putative aminopeptidase FrvX
MNIKETFLELTKYNLPYGFEEHILKYLPTGTKKDEAGNYYYITDKLSRTMFTSHLDDASWDPMEKVNHIIDDDIVSTDGTTILGADDKAGVTIMLYMIEKKIPGTYYFFIGEESGMIGSSDIINSKGKKYFKNKYDRCISFDRKGYGSIITKQMGTYSCSYLFANHLKKQFDSFGLIHKNDPTGVFTDSANFIGIIPECTNLSVGYFNEHTTMEIQDLSYLKRMANISSKIDWEILPTEDYKINNLI